MEPISTRPEVGCSSPATIRSVVVLPHPDGPEQREEAAPGHHQVELVDGREGPELLGDGLEGQVARRAAQARAVACHQLPTTFAQMAPYLASSAALRARNTLAFLARNDADGKMYGLLASSASIFSISAWAPCTGQT